MKSFPKQLKIILSAAAVIVCALCVLPVIISSAYSVYYADDFSHAVGMAVSHVPFLDYLIASFMYARKVYFLWTGTYFAMFLQSLLTPLNNFGLPQLRIVMVMNSVLFFSGLFLLIFKLTEFIPRKDAYLRFGAAACVLFLFTAFNAYDEIFYWFSGSVSYSLPLSVFLFSALCVLKYNKKDSNAFFLLANLGGFCAMGGSLSVAGTSCYILLVILAFYTIQNRSVSKKNVITFSCWVLGAFVNVLAPGNYMRHSNFDSGLNIPKALASSFSTVLYRYSQLFSSAFAVIAFLCLLITGMLISRHLSDPKRLSSVMISAVLGLLTPFVTAFPVALGYSRDILYGPTRVNFMLDFSIIVSLSFFVTAGGILLGRLCRSSLKPILFLSAVPILLIVLNLPHLTDLKQVEIMRELKYGTYQNHYAVFADFIQRLSSYEPGSDVVLNYYAEEIPSPINNLCNFNLESDPNHWVNQSVAHYFGYNSISVNY